MVRAKAMASVISRYIIDQKSRVRQFETVILSFARFQYVPNRALVNASICQTLLAHPH
jgi:hypothetical protein